MQRAHLAEQIERYRNETPRKCKSVGITLRYPIFSDLTSDQLNYYIYWRSTVGTPEFRRAADGYTWLLVCELINLGSRDEASRKLNAVVESEASDRTPLYPELFKTALEYSALNGTPLPRFRPWMSAQESCRYEERLFSEPVSDIPVDVIAGHVPGRWGRSPDDPRAARLFGTVLREYADMLRGKGTTLRKSAFSPVKTTALPFSEYVYLGRKVPLETVYWKAGPAMYDILCMLSDMYHGKAPLRYSRIPFKEELSKIMSAHMASGSMTQGPGIFSKADSVAVRPLGSECGPTGPSCFCDPTAVSSTGGHLTMGEILTFGPAADAHESRYVPSNIEHPVYSDLDRDRFAYYQYWKASFRGNVFLDTDTGYLNLFLTELINTNEGDRTVSVLRRLSKVYGTANLIGEAMAGLAILNRESFTDYRVYKDKMTVNRWIDSFVRGIAAVPVSAEMIDAMRTGSMSARYMGTEVPTEPFGKALGRTFAAINARKDAVSQFAPATVTARRSIFFGIPYLRGPNETVVEYPNYLGCRKFIRFMEKAVDYFTDLMTHLDDKKGSFTFGGTNCGLIMEESFKEWFSGTSGTSKELKLNPDAISAAESELSQVTEMMKVEDEPKEPEKAQENEKKPAEADPWDSLISSLSDDEKRYLALCMDDPRAAASLLKGLGSTRNAMEDAVNGKALDTVRDTVVENGAVVEDYIEEIKERL